MKIVSMTEYVDGIEADGHPPRKAVVLTFDDGWRDNYEHALPVLREMDAPATFYVTTQHLGSGPPDPRRMSAEEISSAARLGVEIGGHTRTHHGLTGVDRATLVSETFGCAEDLRELLGEAPQWFAYPGGDFNAEVASAVRDAGFRAAACSIGPGRNDRSALMWLHREVVGEDLRSRKDRLRLSPVGRRAWSARNRRKLRAQLEKRGAHGD